MEKLKFKPLFHNGPIYSIESGFSIISFSKRIANVFKVIAALIEFSIAKWKIPNSLIN